MKGKLIFEETQTFPGTFPWYLVVSVCLLIITGSSVAFMMGANEPESVIALLSAIVGIGVVLIILSTSKLIVSMDEQAIYYRYPPFINSEKTLRREDIQEIFIRKYKPIWEYGGHGYRYRMRSGRALTITGNIGLQMILSNGKKILLGTQKKELLEAALKRLNENWQVNYG